MTDEKPMPSKPPFIFMPRSTALLYHAGILPAITSQHPTGWLTSILMSAAAAEAFPNDLMATGGSVWKSDSQKPKLQFLISMLERLEESNAQLLAKYEVIFFALSGAPLPRGSEPFQSLRLLIDIRNRLVHCRTLRWTSSDSSPEWTMSEWEQKFARQLSSYKLIPDSKGACDWMQAISNRRAAIWALVTSYDTVKSVVELLSDDPSYQIAMREGLFGNFDDIDRFRRELNEQM